MFFTQEDFRKIEQYLKENARKDTDFIEAQSVGYQDQSVIVQDGLNKRISIYNMFSSQPFIEKVQDLQESLRQQLEELIQNIKPLQQYPTTDYALRTDLIPIIRNNEIFLTTFNALATSNTSEMIDELMQEIDNNYNVLGTADGVVSRNISMETLNSDSYYHHTTDSNNANVYLLNNTYDSRYPIAVYTTDGDHWSYNTQLVTFSVNDAFIVNGNLWVYTGNTPSAEDEHIVRWENKGQYVQTDKDRQRQQVIQNVINSMQGVESQPIPDNVVRHSYYSYVYTDNNKIAIIKKDQLNTSANVNELIETNNALLQVKAVMSDVYICYNISR